MALNMEEWNRIQENVRAGKYGDFNTLRHMLCELEALRNPDEGIGSSDISHMFFGILSGREDMTPEQMVYAIQERY